MSKSAKQLREERNALAKQMNEMVSAAAKEERGLNAEEREKFDKLNADQGDLLKRAQEIETVESILSDSGNPINQGGSLPGRHDVDHRDNPKGSREEVEKAATARDRDLALRAFFLGGPRDRDNISEQHIEACRKLGFDPMRPKMKMSLGSRPPRTNADIERMQTVAGTSYQSTTAALGGNTIADEAMRPLEVALLRYGGMRRAATVLRTATGASLPIPTADGTSEKGAVLAENTSGAIEDLGFGQVTLTAYKYTSKMVRVSMELLQDTAINLTQYIGEELGRRIGRITNQHFTVGTTSTSNPFGLVVEATTGVITASSTGFTFNEIIDLLHSVDPDYRDMPGAAFMLSDATLSRVKKLTDGQGRPLWQPGYVTGDPDTILGKPYIINQDMPTVSTSTSAAPATVRRCIAFGDLSKYLIRDVMNIDLVRLDERYAELAQVAFVAFSRHDGRLLNAGTNPVKYLRVST